MTHSQDKARQLPIGLFDSGVGGLTVLSALRKHLPEENYRYLGDTARLPYGTKGQSTIIRYSLQATEKLVEREIKLLVVACNTATAAALPELRRAYSPLPVIGVVEPGAQKACAASRSGHILVIGTESTIRGGAYTKAIQAIRPEATVTGVPCTLFVPLAEEGWVNCEIARAVAARYLGPVLEKLRTRPDCLVLGCTHFPPLADAIRDVAGKSTALVDSAETTAEAVKQELKRLDLLRGPGQNGPASGARSSLHLMTTDAPERFARAGSLFLGMDINAEDLELVAL